MHMSVFLCVVWPQIYGHQGRNPRVISHSNDPAGLQTQPCKVCLEVWTLRSHSPQCSQESGDSSDTGFASVTPRSLKSLLQLLVGHSVTGLFLFSVEFMIRWWGSMAFPMASPTLALAKSLSPVPPGMSHWHIPWTSVPSLPWAFLVPHGNFPDKVTGGNTMNALSVERPSWTWNISQCSCVEVGLYFPSLHLVGSHQLCSEWTDE